MGALLRIHAHQVDVEVQRRAKSLDVGDCTRPGRVVCIACFLDQMRGNDAVDNAQHLAHYPGAAGEPGRLANRKRY